MWLAFNYLSATCAISKPTNFCITPRMHNLSVLRLCLARCLPVDKSECSQLTSDPNVCWLLVKDTEMVWSDAQLYCEQRGGHLAIANDVPQDWKLRQHVKDQYGFTESPEIWFGLLRSVNGGTWFWANGMTLHVHVFISAWNMKSVRLSRMMQAFFF